MDNSNSSSQKLIIGVFQSERDADDAVNALKQAGFTSAMLGMPSDEDPAQSASSALGTYLVSVNGGDDMRLRDMLMAAGATTVTADVELGGYGSGGDQSSNQ